MANEYLKDTIVVDVSEDANVVALEVANPEVANMVVESATASVGNKPADFIVKNGDIVPDLTILNPGVNSKFQ